MAFVAAKGAFSRGANSAPAPQGQQPWASPPDIVDTEHLCVHLRNAQLRSHDSPSTAKMRSPAEQHMQVCAVSDAAAPPWLARCLSLEASNFHPSLASALHA